MNERDEPDECPACRGRRMIVNDDPGDYPNGLYGGPLRDKHVRCRACGFKGRKLPAIVEGEERDDA